MAMAAMVVLPRPGISPIVPSSTTASTSIVQ